MAVSLYKRIDCCNHCIGCRNNRAARSLLINNNLSTTSKLFVLHQICIAGLINTCRRTQCASQIECCTTKCFASRKL